MENDALRGLAQLEADLSSPKKGKKKAEKEDDSYQGPLKRESAGDEKRKKKRKGRSFLLIPPTGVRAQPLSRLTLAVNGLARPLIRTPPTAAAPMARQRPAVYLEEEEEKRQEEGHRGPFG